MAQMKEIGGEALERLRLRLLAISVNTESLRALASGLEGLAWAVADEDSGVERLVDFSVDVLAVLGLGELYNEEEEEEEAP